VPTAIAFALTRNATATSTVPTVLTNRKNAVSAVLRDNRQRDEYNMVGKKNLTAGSYCKTMADLYNTT